MSITHLWLSGADNKALAALQAARSWHGAQQDAFDMVLNRLPGGRIWHGAYRLHAYLVEPCEQDMMCITTYRLYAIMPDGVHIIG